MTHHTVRQINHVHLFLWPESLPNRDPTVISVTRILAVILKEVAHYFVVSFIFLIRLENILLLFFLSKVYAPDVARPVKVRETQQDPPPGSILIVDPRFNLDPGDQDVRLRETGLDRGRGHVDEEFERVVAVRIPNTFLEEFFDAFNAFGAGAVAARVG